MCQGKRRDAGDRRSLALPGSQMQLKHIMTIHTGTLHFYASILFHCTPKHISITLTKCHAAFYINFEQICEIKSPSEEFLVRTAAYRDKKLKQR